MARENGAFCVDGKWYEFDDLTLDEIDEIEELIGGGFYEADFGRAKTLRAMIFVLVRRDRPDVSLKEIGRMKMGELFEMTPADSNGAPIAEVVAP